MTRASTTLGALCAAALLLRAVPLAALTPQDIPRATSLYDALMNPRGDLVALMVSEPGRFTPRVEVYDVQTGKRTRVLRVADGPRIVFHELRWADSEHLVLQTGTRGMNFFMRGGGGEVTDTVVSRIERKDGSLQVVEARVELDGTVVDTLPLEPGMVLVTPESEPGRLYRRSVAKALIDATAKRAPAKRDGAEAPVAEVEGEALDFLIDPHGQARGAITLPREGVVRVLYREHARGAWRILFESEAPDYPDWLPLGFSADGARLLVIKGDPKEREAVYWLDPATGRARLAFSSATGDIRGVARGAAGEVTGVSTIERGGRRIHYFERSAHDLVEGLAAHLSRNVFVIDTTPDRSSALIFAEAANDPGVIYHRAADGTLTQVAAVAPELPREELAPVQPLQVPTKGGVTVQAFLALPLAAVEPVPLVVMPHGGPIGVADTHHFNAELQYLVAHGFGVLQVNYRGSSGYGRAFEESGKRQWGRGIEDDIDAAIDAAVATGKIDAGRMCIVGASYGGYSALISVVRHPDRFRCAASLAAPTDLPLLFSTTDSARTEEGRKRWAEIVGDPQKEFDRMLEVSPVYRADRIKVPIQLAHGMQDTRVDPEHAIRMKLVLDALGLDFEWIPLKYVGHGGWVAQVEWEYQRHRASFLKRHLRKRD